MSVCVEGEGEGEGEEGRGSRANALGNPSMQQR